METEVYCVYSDENVLISDCMDCFFLYDCDNNWCDNHKCEDCNNKDDGLCEGMM